MTDSATTPLRQLLQSLAAGPACLVTVESTQGSVPRGAGTWMALAAAQPDAPIGTIKTCAIATATPLTFILIYMIYGMIRWMVSDYKNNKAALNLPQD